MQRKRKRQNRLEMQELNNNGCVQIITTIAIGATIIVLNYVMSQFIGVNWATILTVIIASTALLYVGSQY